MLLILSGRSFIKTQYSSFPLFPVAYPFRIATYYNITSSGRNCKVNDIIFPSARARDYKAWVHAQLSLCLNFKVWLVLERVWKIKYKTVIRYAETIRISKDQKLL